jgi:hypothetical protein
LERESNHSPLFHAEVRLLAAAFALTYVSMAVCYAQGHLIFPALTIPPRHVRLCSFFFFSLLLLLLLLLFVNKYRSSEVGRDSLVSIATRYGVGSPGIECRWGRYFPGPGAYRPSSKWLPSLFPGSKAAGALN